MRLWGSGERAASQRGSSACPTLAVQVGLSAALSSWRSLPPPETAAEWEQLADVLGQVGGAQRKAKLAVQSFAAHADAC